MTFKEALEACRKVGTAHAQGDTLRAMYADMIAFKWYAIGNPDKFYRHLRETMTLAEIRRLDECLATCIETPINAVAKIDLSLLREWLEYADGQVWKPRRLRQMARAARRRIKRVG